MSLLLLLLLLTVATTSATTLNQPALVARSFEKCGNVSREACCDKMVVLMENTWSTGKNYLTRYLQSLKTLNCTQQLSNECQQRKFDLTGLIVICSHFKNVLILVSLLIYMPTTKLT